MRHFGESHGTTGRWLCGRSGAHRTPRGRRGQPCAACLPRAAHGAAHQGVPAEVVDRLGADLAGAGGRGNHAASSRIGSRRRANSLARRRVPSDSSRRGTSASGRSGGSSSEPGSWGSSQPGPSRLDDDDVVRFAAGVLHESRRSRRRIQRAARHGDGAMAAGDL